MLAESQDLPVLFLLLSAFFSIFAVLRPIIGFYGLFPAVFLLPAALKLPGKYVTNSPFDILVIITTIVAVFRFLNKHKRLPFNPFFIPLLAIGIMLFLFTLAKYGDDNGQPLLRFIQGLAIFVPTLLLIETPKQARLTLLILLITLGIRMGAIGLINWYFASSSVISTNESSLLRLSGDHPISMFLGLGGADTTWPMLLVAPVFLALALLGLNNQSRIWGWIGYWIAAFFVLTAGFFMNVVGFAVGTFTVVLISYFI